MHNLNIDISQYFNNIDHEILLKYLKKILKIKKLLK